MFHSVFLFLVFYSLILILIDSFLYQSRAIFCYLCYFLQKTVQVFSTFLMIAIIILFYGDLNSSLLFIIIITKSYLLTFLLKPALSTLATTLRLVILKNKFYDNFLQHKQLQHHQSSRSFALYHENHNICMTEFECFWKGTNNDQHFFPESRQLYYNLCLQRHQFYHNPKYIST